MFGIRVTKNSEYAINHQFIFGHIIWNRWVEARKKSARLLIIELTKKRFVKICISRSTYSLSICYLQKTDWTTFISNGCFIILSPSFLRLWVANFISASWLRLWLLSSWGYLYETSLCWINKVRSKLQSKFVCIFCRSHNDDFFNLRF